MLFFFVFFFQLIIMIVQTIGLPGEREKFIFSEFLNKNFFVLDGGTVGVFTAVTMFDGKAFGTLLGLFCLAIAICFGLSAGGTALMLTKVRAFTSILITL